MPRALCLIRPQPEYRRDSFVAGLRACGYEVSFEQRHHPSPGDLLLIWNRYGIGDKMATAYERAGAKVLVAENGYLGREWNGGRWYAMARNRHNGAGKWAEGGPERWNYPLKPWRTDGNHILILPQRGIGVAPVAMPPHWAAATARQLVTGRPVVVRAHPGENAPQRTLEADLEGAWACITWGSGAALKALVAGIPVFAAFKQWVGMPAATLWPGDIESPWMGDRLPMFQRLIWAMYSLEEISSGFAFRRLLGIDK